MEFYRKNYLMGLLIRKKTSYINNARDLTVIIIRKQEKYWIGERIKYVKDKGDVVKKVCFKEKNNPRQVLKHLREVG